MATILENLGTITPVTLNALQKITGLTQTQLTLELVKLGGAVAVLDGGLILAPPITAADQGGFGRGPLLVGQVGRRPRTEREAEIHICRELIIDTIRNTGSASAPQVHRDSGFTVDYRNLGRAATALLDMGLITELKKGRTRVWIAAEAVELPEAEFEVLGG